MLPNCFRLTQIVCFEHHHTKCQFRDRILDFSCQFLASSLDWFLKLSLVWLQFYHHQQETTLKTLIVAYKLFRQKVRMLIFILKTNHWKASVTKLFIFTGSWIILLFWKSNIASIINHYKSLHSIYDSVPNTWILVLH